MSGLPYIGSKKSIAKYILDIIPPAENFYDLFGGGAAISLTALKSGKWNNVYYNELNTEIVNVICWLSDDYDNAVHEIERLYVTPIDRQEFFCIKNKQERTPIDTVTLIAYSFGNDQKTYLWSQENECLKLPIIRRLAESIINDGVRYPDFKQYRRKWLKDNNVIQKTAKLQAIESLERIERLGKMENLHITNLDDKDVQILPDSVVYCDIPYYGSNEVNKNKYGVVFNHQEFYSWVRNAEFPVYYSGYDTDAGGFMRVWEREHICRLTKKDGKALKRVECLFWNGR